ncbi:hypothetical protein ILUMI_08938 [Ignelater luminosus]|uniref:Uncharacterized protein n=1 Tax=Ignelater luminosus TaxID=2038154 RepID=A0A8K0D4U7_IGNLU|nr:hypothetical protein ILUMI_08938 [Ignelater luminosus]
MYAKAFLITSMTRNRERKPPVEKLAPVRSGKIIIMDDETRIAQLIQMMCLVENTIIVLKRLILFIKTRDVLFWSDMATCHYAVQCTEFLKENNVDFVIKVNNAPNTPQVRPIEKYWALLNREYANRKTPAKNLNSFRRIMQITSRKVSENNGPTLMSNLRKKLRQVGRKGVYEPYKH